MKLINATGKDLGSAAMAIVEKTYNSALAINVRPWRKTSAAYDKTYGVMIIQATLGTKKDQDRVLVFNTNQSMVKKTQTINRIIL